MSLLYLCYVFRVLINSLDKPDFFLKVSLKGWSLIRVIGLLLEVQLLTYMEI